MAHKHRHLSATLQSCLAPPTVHSARVSTLITQLLYAVRAPAPVQGVSPL